jgi:hypothetical protein
MSRWERHKEEVIVPLVMVFNPPETQERFQAIGPFEELPESLQRVFYPDQVSFAPIPIPKLGDWLAAHREKGQTFKDFSKAGWNKPDKIRNKIYLQPLGEFTLGESPPLEALKEYYQKVGFDDEATWVANRLKIIIPQDRS